MSYCLFSFVFLPCSFFTSVPECQSCWKSQVASAKTKPISSVILRPMCDLGAAETHPFPCELRFETHALFYCCQHYEFIGLRMFLCLFQLLKRVYGNFLVSTEAGKWTRNKCGSRYAALQYLISLKPDWVGFGRRGQKHILSTHH